jgi:hypothetical protein
MVTNQALGNQEKTLIMRRFLRLTVAPGFSFRRIVGSLMAGRDPTLLPVRSRLANGEATT